MNEVESRCSFDFRVKNVALGDEVDAIQDQRGEVEVHRGWQVFLECAKECCGDE